MYSLAFSNVYQQALGNGSLFESKQVPHSAFERHPLSVEF